MRRLAQFCLFVPASVLMSFSFLCVELLMGAFSRDQQETDVRVSRARMHLSAADDCLWNWFREEW